MLDRGDLHERWLFKGVVGGGASVKSLYVGSDQIYSVSFTFAGKSFP